MFVCLSVYVSIHVGMTNTIYILYIITYIYIYNHICIYIYIYIYTYIGIAGKARIFWLSMWWYVSMGLGSSGKSCPGLHMDQAVK